MPLTSEEAREAREAWEAREIFFKQCREEAERDALRLTAENARRASLHPTERLAEDGAKLLQEIESNDDMVAVLEASRSARAGCRASDCFYYRRDRAIQDEFRIRLENVRGELDHYRTKHYYHVLCFEAMMDLEGMIPARKFLCDPNHNWGLIVRKWFEHRGRIDPKVLVEFIKEREGWEKKQHGGIPLTLVNSVNGPSKEKDTGPVLGDFVTSRPCELLVSLLQLSEIEAGRMQFISHPSRPFMLQGFGWPGVDRSIEGEAYGPKTEEEVRIELEQQQEWQDEKREILRDGWDYWQSPTDESPGTSVAGDDETEPEATTADTHKRGRSMSADGEEKGSKRQKVRCDDDAEDKA